ncbi:MAG TPA: alpha-glucosidase C-terminal domain-containing protein, partial [Metabacillus sp.]|nr:alpha-glucosidase C-terminal domain-containing protein [Metabacillus sp.]
NYPKINAEKAVAEENSIFYHYQKLISLRKEYDIITTGDYELLLENDPSIFAYLRNTQTEKLLVINNFYDKPATFILPEHVDLRGYKKNILLSNYKDTGLSFENMTLRPYESVVYHLTK